MSVLGTTKIVLTLGNIAVLYCTLLECPFTKCYFQKSGYDFNACNNVRDILYNTDAITAIVKLIVHTPVGKLIAY